MPVESNKRKMELKNEIVGLWLRYDGKDLEGLTIEQLTTLRDLLKKANDYLSSLKN